MSFLIIAVALLLIAGVSLMFILLVVFFDQFHRLLQ